MTTLLQTAINKATAMPDALQNALAQQILEDLAWELCWDEKPARSQSMLARMAEKACVDYHSGKTKKLGFDQLLRRKRAGHCVVLDRFTCTV
ncbi:MAG: hypothetical protein NTV22_19375 [bacterium]|nr:hypothetical protein [bacterium]